MKYVMSIRCACVEQFLHTRDADFCYRNEADRGASKPCSPFKCRSVQSEQCNGDRPAVRRGAVALEGGSVSGPIRWPANSPRFLVLLAEVMTPPDPMHVTTSTPIACDGKKRRTTLSNLTIQTCSYDLTPQTANFGEWDFELDSSYTSSKNVCVLQICQKLVTKS